MSKPAEQDAVVRSLVELLALAKVAMPDYLFAIDPRVHRARQLIATRSQVSGSRPPSILVTPAMEMVDLAPPATIMEVEQMPDAEPPWDVTIGLDAFMASDLAPKSSTEAVVLILRDWLISHGYLEAPPESKEAH